MYFSADSYSIYKIGIFKSAKKSNFNHTSLGNENIMYDFIKNVKDKYQKNIWCVLRGLKDMNKTIYVKCDGHSKVNQDKVYLKDVAEVYCADATIAGKAKSTVISHLKKKGDRKVISMLYIMEQMEKVIPGVQVQSIGETDVIVEWEKQEKAEAFKVALVCFIAFFGTAFTIMAFHNDIGIRSVFKEVYHLTSGTEPEGVGILELSYCLGLFLGITVFFNHIGKKKFTDDPTPVAVAMHNYERDVNQSIVENAERRGVEESE